MVRPVITTNVLCFVRPEADPASFELIGGNLTRDKKRIWYNYEIQHAVDPATVEPIKDGPVYRNNNSVFYKNDAIAGADLASFKHIGSDIRTVPLRGHRSTPTPPESQLRAFTRSDLVGRGGRGRQTPHANPTSVTRPAVNSRRASIIALTTP